MVQAYEYMHAPFGFKDSIYGATFFMATGFHGFHVLIGTIFLLVCLIRAMKGDFTPKQHFGFEAAAWYWHFVDVVWLFLFACIYVWASAGAPIGALTVFGRCDATAAAPARPFLFSGMIVARRDHGHGCSNLLTIAAWLAALSGAHAADKVDLVRVDKSERRMELLAKGKVLRSYSDRARRQSGRPQAAGRRRAHAGGPLCPRLAQSPTAAP